MDTNKLVAAVFLLAGCAPVRICLAQTPDGVFRVGGGVSAPVVLYKVDAEYSEEARKAKYSGTVVLQAVVDATGTARDIRVVRSLGLGLDENAVEAVKKWKFRPGYRNGKPVAVLETIEVTFRLGRTSRRPTQPTENEKPQETTGPVNLSQDQEVQRKDAAATREPITTVEKAEGTERAEKPKETESPQRFENLLIQVIRMPPPEKAYGFGTLAEMLADEILLPPQKGHYFFAVRARVRNVSEKLAICANLEATLQADFGLQYHSAWMVKNRPATISELLPGEETEGDLVFMLKNGVRPLELELYGWEGGCNATKTFSKIRFIVEKIPLSKRASPQAAKKVSSSE